jgi:O-methyltransferase domain/Dimerisation domain
MLSTNDTASAPQTMTSENGASPSATLLYLAAGSWISQAIYVAAKLGLADLLVASPQSTATLAAITGTHADALYRVLRALASVGVFAEDDSHHFHLTPTAECLCSEVPGSLRAFAIMLGEQEHWRSWGDILYSVKTGLPAFEHVFGVPRFRYLADHPEDARIFSEAMTSRSGQENDAIIAAYNFSELKNVIDIGGGQGSLLRAILRATSRTRCVLFDLPDVITIARGAADQAEYAARLEFVGGSFFEMLPAGAAGADAYVLKKVIHNWDDDRAIAILTNCRRAMPLSGRLLIIEPIIPPDNIRSFNKLLDLLLLVWHGSGKARTESEHRAILTASNLKVAQVIPTESWLSIIEASPAN